MCGAVGRKSGEGLNEYFSSVFTMEKLMKAGQFRGGYCTQEAIHVENAIHFLWINVEYLIDLYFLFQVF